MNCRKCGNLLNENDPFCRVCGEPVNQMAQNQTMQNQGGTNQGVQNQGNTQNSNTATPAYNNQQPVNNPNAYPINNGYQQPGMPAMQNYGAPIPPANNIASPVAIQNNQKNSNKGFLIILIILLLIIAGLGGFIAYKTLGENKTDTKEPDNKKDDNKKNDDNKNEGDDDNKNPVVENPGSSTKGENKHVLNGYTFILPNDLVYNKTNESITGTDSLSSPTLYFNLYVEDYSYETAKNSINDVLTELTTEGFTVVNHGIVTYKNREFYAIIVSKNGETGVCYITSLDSIHSVNGFIMGLTETAIDTAFEKVASIVENASSASEFVPNQKGSEFNGLKGKQNYNEYNIKGVNYNLK